MNSPPSGSDAQKHSPRRMSPLLDLSEFQKMDGGLSCLSLRF
jgi:hypothetical protein